MDSNVERLRFSERNGFCGFFGASRDSERRHQKHDCVVPSICRSEHVQRSIARMTIKRLSLAFCATVFAFGIAACGDDDGGGGGGGGNNTEPSSSFTATPACTMSSSDGVTFASTSTDADGDTLTCSWTFASGNPSTSSDCTVSGVTFPNRAPYQVVLTVSDGNGGTGIASMQVMPCT
jgi:hypothetical protein